MSEPAFPSEQWSDKEGLEYSHPGMSLRDYFAGQAIGGIHINEYSIEYVSNDIGLTKKDTYIASKHFPRFIAKRAYAIADAMLAESNKEAK